MPAGWLLFVLSVALIACALVLWAVGGDEAFTADILLFPLAYLSFGAVGAVIVTRQPGNRIGRLGLVAGLTGGVVGVLDAYARLAAPVPGQSWAALLATAAFPFSLGPILFLVLLFPTGHLPSPRWWIAAAILGTGVAGLALGNLLSPTFPDYPYRNPIGIEAMAGSPFEHGGIAWFLVLAGAVAAAAGLVVRLRRSTGAERQQLKWVTYAASLHSVSWVVLAIDLGGPAGELAQYAVFATLALIPVAAGIAILRYRLYDIDVVIRRTLVYGAVIALLGAVYVALVLVLQAALSDVTGGQTLPVALSTLVIAALFGPVRGRVRDAVDRRFYRSRYDAQRTLEAFAGRLRGEVELEAVAGALAAAVIQTVRPAAVGTWIRGRS